ncbi:hypothetical protein CTI12_AA617790 [Artemisia annua]|uniref:Uncharacterized protein n=1 Tax=Artemisia annua TaxID=35608 RepID=A0A2U1KCX9_ARTAN|nr:hypothetical protein CTI12_AA617790 [Artemisia annua]
MGLELVREIYVTRRERTPKDNASVRSGVTIPKVKLQSLMRVTNSISALQPSFKKLCGPFSTRKPSLPRPTQLLFPDPGGSGHDDAKSVASVKSEALNTKHSVQELMGPAKSAKAETKDSGLSSNNGGSANETS